MSRSLFNTLLSSCCVVVAAWLLAAPPVSATPLEDGPGVCSRCIPDCDFALFNCAMQCGSVVVLGCSFELFCVDPQVGRYKVTCGY